MKTIVKNLSDDQVELTISLGEKELADAEIVAISKLASKVKVAGFRPGHVPAAIVKKNVPAETLAEQTLNDALNKAVALAFTSKNIQALERPQVEVTKFVPGESVEFKAKSQVVPPVILGDYRQLKVKPAAISVTDKEINEVLERIRQGYSEKTAVEREAQLGDIAVIDFVGKKDDVAFDGGSAKGYELEIGSHSFIPGFEEAIVGHKAGESFDVKLSFPKEYHEKKLAGQPVVFSTKLQTVKEKKLPKLDDSLAAKAGPFKKLAELKADIKQELTTRKENEAKEALKDDLVKQLVAKSTVVAPAILIKDQESSIERDMQQNLAYQGLSLDQYLTGQHLKDRAEWYQKEVTPAAVSRVKAGLVLAELSKAEKITATDQEIEDHINLYKQRYGSNAAALKEFEKPEARREIANRLLTEKTVDRLVELSTKKATK